MAVFGYARVSTSHQTLDGQLDALSAAGAERVFGDKLSGARDDRPGLRELLDFVREGDTVIVTALDRLGRSLRGILETVETLTSRGVVLRSLRENVDGSTPTGRMLIGIFGSLAEYERLLINERAAVAREAAASRGRQVGRPRAISPDQLRAARAMRGAGESMATVCSTLNVKRATLYAALASPEQEAAGK